MGLTIAYKLSTVRRLKLAGVKKLVSRLHAKAVARGFDHIGKPFKVGPDYPRTYYIPPGAKRICDVIMASEGWIFHATPGDGSESVMLGLCRFPSREGWWLESFCKTQYASRHGWEHFLKCHLGVIELLWTAKHLGLDAQVQDDGDLWETGSFAVLRRNLETYDRCLAAFGGALKDRADEARTTVESPIFNHPNFEHLEAEGMAVHGVKISQAARVAKRLASSLS